MPESLHKDMMILPSWINFYLLTSQPWIALLIDDDQFFSSSLTIGITKFHDKPYVFMFDYPGCTQIQLFC